VPITGLPTFTSGILTAAQLNAIVTALEEKFSGKVTTGDFSWPFTAGGNINMAQYSILNLAKFWNVYNAGDRAAGTTLQSVIDSISSDGGGVVLVAGGRTEAVPAAGITIPANVILMGAGPSSVLQMNGSASAAMVTFGSGADNASIRNLTLRGDATVNQIFIDVNNADNTQLASLQFDTHGTSEFVKVQGGAVNVSLNDCVLTGNLDAQANKMVNVIQSEGLKILRNRFLEWSDQVLHFEPGAGAAVDGTIVAGNLFERNGIDASALTAEAAVIFDNTNAVACEGWTFADNLITGESENVGGLAIHGNALDGVIIDGNTIWASLDQPAVLVDDNTSEIAINDNVIIARNGDGVVLGSNHGTDVTAGTATASAVLDVAVTGNTIYCNPSSTAGNNVALVVAVSVTSGGLRAAISSNKMSTGSAHCLEIWNVTSVSNRPLFTTVSGNLCDVRDDNYKGFASYSDMGSTNDGDIGTAAVSWWFTMVGNHIPGATSGTDYTHSAANKCIVQDNNT
jgi:hypothetical protein